MIRAVMVLVALAWLGAGPKAHAQQNVVSCNWIVGASGQQSCSTALSSKAFPANLTNTVVAVKATGGVVAMVHCYNPNAAEAVVQLFNAPPGAVTLGTTVPYAIVPIAATSTGGWALSPLPVGFGVAISVAATTTASGGVALGTALDCNVYYN